MVDQTKEYGIAATCGKASLFLRSENNCYVGDATATGVAFDPIHLRAFHIRREHVPNVRCE